MPRLLLSLRRVRSIGHQQLPLNFSLRYSVLVMILRRERSTNNVHRFAPTSSAAIYSRPTTRAAGFPQFVELVVCLLRKVVSVLVPSHKGGLYLSVGHVSSHRQSQEQAIPASSVVAIPPANREWGIRYPVGYREHPFRHNGP